MNNAKKNRLAWIDIAKGIGIIFVVIGHCFRKEMRIESYLCEFIYQMIYFFHMPLFFAISGVTFQMILGKYRDKRRIYVKNKIKTLLIPFMSYGMIIYMAFSIARSIPQIHQILKRASYPDVSIVEYIKDNIMGRNPYAVHLWFVWVLFLISVFAIFICSRIKKDTIPFLVMMIIGAFILRLIVNSHIETIEYFLKNIQYFCLGILISKFSGLLQKKQAIISMFCTVPWLGMALMVIWEKHIAPQWYILEEALRFIIISMAIISILRLAVRIGKNNLLERWGQDSFTIYLLHQPLCCGFTGVLLYNKLNFPILPTCIICIVLSFLVPYTVIHIAGRAKWIGKILKVILNI